MFDDRRQDVIMEEMMSAFGPDVRTDEGSLAYNACAKIGEKLEEVYEDMDEINDNLNPETMDEAHLIQYGEERGLSYRYATAPVVKGVFQQEIELGERLVCNDYTYEVTEKIQDFEYKMLCDTEGVEANANLGELTPEDYIDEYKGGQIAEVITLGVDDEDVEAYRKKVLETFQTTEFSGNKAYYKRHVNAIAGVGGCKPRRRKEGETDIKIYVISSEFTEPSSTLVDEIQTIVDPIQNAGEGDGIAPIDHEVTIKAVEGVAVNVWLNIVFDTGYSLETSQESVKAVISEYLKELCAQWESKGNNDTVVRISQIESRVLTVDGVVDVSGTKINDATENLLLEWSQIPTLGGVTIV